VEPSLLVLTKPEFEVLFFVNPQIVTEQPESPAKRRPKSGKPTIFKSVFFFIIFERG
jgi:hypothetical protein